MMKELMGRVDEMYGASLLTGVALYSMHMGIGTGIVELCIGGVIALLVTKAVRGGSRPLEETGV